MKKLKGKLVLVTGGASFIGSHLVDTLLRKGAEVRVADDFSSGKLENLQHPLKRKSPDKWTCDNLTIYRGDLKDRRFAREMIDEVDVIFHLAALHGGGGEVYIYPAVSFF